MATRVVEGKKPYTGGEAINIDDDKVISLRLRDENNLIIYDEGDDEIYVDLQLPDEITPTDAFPVGVTTGRVIVDNGWDKAGTIICAKTTSGDEIKLLYADDGTLWMDNGTGTFKQIYFKADVDALLLALRTYIDGELAKKQNGVASATAPENPVQGDQWYDTTNNELKVYDGSNWTGVGGGDVLVSDQANNIFTPGMKIWGGTETDYQSLTPDSNTAYLLLAGGPTPPTPTGWDTITGFVYDNKSFAFGTEEQEVQGMCWNDDGTKFYLVGEGSDHVYQYSCSTAYDISTASYDNKSLDVTGQTTVPNNIRFKPDGTQLYVLGYGHPNYIYIYDLSTAWDISTATYNGPSSPLDDRCSTAFITGDGLQLFAYSYGTHYLKKYSLSTAWDLTSFSTADQSITLTETQNIYFNPQGTQMFGLRRVSGATYIDLYLLGTAWNLNTLSSPTSQYISNGDAMALSFNDDGSKAYLCFRTGPNRTIYEYITTTA